MNSEDMHEELADLGASALLMTYSVDDLEAGRHDADLELAERAITLADAIALEDVAIPLSDAISSLPGGWDHYPIPRPERTDGRGMDPPMLGVA